MRVVQKDDLKNIQKTLKELHEILEDSNQNIADIKSLLDDTQRKISRIQEAENPTLAQRIRGALRINKTRT